MKKVNGPLDVPKGQHYAVLVYKQESVYIESDERRRNHPGHTQIYNTFEHYVTDNRHDWLDYIRRLEHSSVPQSYVALEVKGKAKVSRKVEVDIQ